MLESVVLIWEKQIDVILCKEADLLFRYGLFGPRGDGDLLNIISQELQDT